MDCQELHLTAGDIEFMITGDLSREELKDLAV
jgi:anti-sigma factor RsiW